MDEGYPDSRAIPIAIDQAKNGMKMLVNQKNEPSKRKNPSKTDEHDTNPRAGKLLDSDVIVEYEEKQWIVKSKGAKRQATILIQKEAIEKGKQVAQNKQSTLIIYKKMGQKKKKSVTKRLKEA